MDYKKIAELISKSKKKTPAKVYIQGNFNQESFKGQGFQAFKKAFYGYLLTKDFVKVAEEAVDVTEKHLKNVKSLYGVGMASKFDLLRSEVQVANLKPQLIKARNNLKIAELSLKTLLGLDLSQPIEVKGYLTYEPFEPDLEESVSKAMLKRPEISQLKYQKQMAGQGLKLARASNLPSFAVSATYNFWADQLNFRLS